MSEYVASIPLPEGVQVTCSVLAVQYIDPDGTMRYAVGTRGDAVMTTLLGLTVVAQERILTMERGGDLGGGPPIGGTGE